MATAEATRLLKTTGDIVAETGYPMHKVLYAIKSRKIQHVQRVGKTRLFSVEQVDQIKRVLPEIHDFTPPRS